ncbi:DUF874 domain-containing protein [Sulfitobacter sp. TSTF-M16]|uniref:DUF874 domain-containing protein n=1 Tax=Sulfitobacter aestuariivivens TaxID=2766981 RepID=A0A927CZQ7_9RHOB|nr:DUF874 domain-containing protein [Sulfitobacter aestuariivivens]MBD3662403.1 DUF874 domain-containing protein [Sulfitobacter aestuariivivens]
MGPIYSLADFLDMLRRRVGVISFVVISGCFASVIWALSIPHLYRSAEVIQIEQPKIDSELAPTTVAGSSARRLQLIEQQLMSRNSLTDIIDQFGLYDHLDALRPSEKVDLLRQSVSIAGVAAVREGFADDGTISVLTISAEMETAALAQAVAQEFADRTRALSAAQRQEQTAETLAFFTQQEENLERDIAALEVELAAFRSENDLSIEGSLDFRRDEIASLNTALLALDREIIAAQLARTRIDPNQRADTVRRLETELDATLESLTTQRSLLQDRRNTLSASIRTTPEVERTLAEFERRMELLQGQLDVISTRRNEAEVGNSLETAARGERLITIEEASLPDYPITTSRKSRVFLGTTGALALGLVIAFLLELRRPVLRTARQMERETGLRPVVSIPEMRPRQMRPKKGFAKIWEDRRLSGQRGRAARLARGPDMTKS